MLKDFTTALRPALVLTILFSLFCYALELERLGKAIEGERARIDR